MKDTKGRSCNFVDGVPLGTSVQGGHGSSTSYPQTGAGKNKKPGKSTPAKSRTESYWPLGKAHYTQHHSG